MRRLKDHTFAVCAYGESPYLDEAVASVVNQTLKSRVIICTSTPNEHINAIASKYNIDVKINPCVGDIQTDWNFACNSANTRYVTLVHQDDVYSPKYLECFYKRIKNQRDFLIYYTAYRPLNMRDGIGDTKKDANSIIRFALCTPMLIPYLADKRIIKKATLSLGNSICCPTVTYDRKTIADEDVFTSEIRYDIDWDTFWKFASREGRFLFEPKNLVYYRVHDLATSKQCIDNSIREKDDIYMFSKIFSPSFAKIIMKVYKRAYLNYR